MAARPDQPAAEVQQLATDEFNTINGELGERLADRMVAPATAVEAYDGSPTSSISTLSEAGEPAAEQGDFHQPDDTNPGVPAATSEHAGSTTDEEMFSSVHHSPDGSMADDEDDEWQPALVGGQPTPPPSTTLVPSRAEQLQSVAVGDGDTQGGGSYLLDGSDISPPQPRRTASGSNELLAPKVAATEARLDKLETAVNGLETAVTDLADGQRATQHQLQTSTAGLDGTLNRIMALLQPPPAAQNTAASIPMTAASVTVHASSTTKLDAALESTSPTSAGVHTHIAIDPSVNSIAAPPALFLLL